MKSNFCSPSNALWNSHIFHAFDGDLSLTNGGTANFGAFVPVPEPSALSLAAAALALAVLRRTRRTG